MRKSLRILILGLVSIGLAALTLCPAVAQVPTTVSPSQLVIQGVQGTRVSRTLVIHADSALTDLQVIPVALTDNEAGEAFPAQAIQIEIAESSAAPDQLVTVPVSFDLAQVTPGVYQGELLINHDDGSFTVPVLVTVKTAPWLPLAALILGVALGIAVSSYRTRGRPRDEAMVRLGQIRTQMKVDEQLQTLGEPFLQQIEVALVNAEVALEGQQWPQAQEAIETADVVWSRWRRGRPDWIVQLTAYMAFLEHIEPLADDSPYMTEVVQAAQDAYRDIPNLDEPQFFKERLDSLRNQVNKFLALEARLDLLSRLGTNAATLAEVYRRQLNQQSPFSEESREAYETLRQQVETAILKQRKQRLNNRLTSYRRRYTSLTAAESPMAADMPPEPDVLAARAESLPAAADDVYLELYQDLEVAFEALIRRASEDDILEGTVSTPFQVPDNSIPLELEDMSPAAVLTQLPDVHVRTLEDRTLAAGRRLRWFAWLTYGTAVVLLALAGFVELYMARPSFGAQGLADYFALLAWGFGAEATRSAISDMVQSWGLVRQ